VSGQDRPVTLGFIDGDDGAILVAAGSPDAAWAANLLADPRVEVTLRGETWAAEAEPLDRGDPRLAAAVRELILRFGTPSERLGSGPVFVIRPVGAPR
jgi:deazaflavin-dependent oxidoreductase (nitroreductase family)